MKTTKTILFIIVLLILSGSIFSYVFLDNNFLIRKWNLPLDPPGFFDSRQFAWAAESHAQGYDPLFHNPVNPSGQRLNYPRIWQLLFALGINESHTNLMGSIVTVVFFIGIGLFWFSGKFDNLTYIILSIIVLSPPVMLGIERSNIELILFFIISLALTLNYYSGISTFFLLVFASILKIYPVFGFIYLLKEKEKRFWTLFLSALGIVIFYAVLTMNDFVQIYNTTPKTASSSFGINVWWMGLKSKRYFGLPLSESLVLFFKVFSYAATLIILASTLFFGLRTKNRLYGETKYIDAFRVGAGIYIGCFILMNTLDYRLIFLIFTIPQMVVWLREKGKDLSLVPLVTLAAMVLSTWNYFIVRFAGRKLTFVMEEACNWIILAGLLYLFFSSLPEWLTSYLRKPVTAIKA